MYNNIDSNKAMLFCLCLVVLFSILPNSIANKSKNIDFIKGDSYYYKAMVESLIHDLDLSLANNIPEKHHYNGQLAIDKTGRLVPKHPIFFSILSMPFYYLWGQTGLLIYNFFNSILLFLLIFLINKIFHNSFLSFLVSITYTSTTLFFDYFYNFSPDIISTVFILSSVYFLLKIRFALAVFFLGFSICIKISNLIFVIPVLIYIIYNILTDKEHKIYSIKSYNLVSFFFKYTHIFAIFSILFVSLCPIFFANWYFFDSPFISGYDRAVAGISASGKYVYNIHSKMFNQPILKGSFNLLFDPRKGILCTNPILIFSLMGFIYSIKLHLFDKRLLLLVVLCLVQFSFFSKFDGWSNSHFSNRYLMTFIALSSVFTCQYFKVFFSRLLNT